MKVKTKQTEIGEIPEEWEVVKIKNISKTYSGGTPSRNNKEYYGGNIPWVKSGEVNLGLIYETEEKITENGLKFSNAKNVSKETVLIALYGATAGKVGLLKIDATTNQAVLAVPNTYKKFNPNFMYYLLSSKEHKLINTTQGTGQPNLSKNLIDNLMIQLPPMIEQSAISDILLIIDERIDIVERERQRVERLKVGIMRELFEGKKWITVKLSDIAEILDSRRIPLSEMERSKIKGGYPYCGANGVIDYINKYIFDGEYILIAEDGGDYSKFGKSAYIMTGKFWVNNHAHVLKAIEGKTTNEFLFYILNFMDLSPYIVGSTRTKLNQERLKEIQIPLPDLGEQKKITSILKIIDNKLSIQQNKKSKLETIKKGLMNDLLTGKKRVKVLK